MKWLKNTIATWTLALAWTVSALAGCSAGCSEEITETSKENIELTTSTTAEKSQEVLDGPKLKNDNKTAIEKSCYWGEELATLDEKAVYMKNLDEIKRAEQEYTGNNKSIKIINTPSDEDEDIYKDIIISLDTPVIIEGKSYNHILVNYSKNKSDWLLTKFFNNNDGKAFPILKFTNIASRNWKKLCREARYYDPVEWYNLTTKSSQWKAVTFNNDSEQYLIDLVLKELKK